MFRDSKGYERVKVGGKTLYLHRLVWEDHFGEIPKGFHIHHIDGDKTNNEVSNLEMISAHEHIVKRHADNFIKMQKKGQESARLSCAWKKGLEKAHELEAWKVGFQKMNSPESRAKTRKKVRIWNESESLIFDSVKDAKEYIGDKGHLSAVLTGKRKSCCGYKAEYIGKANNSYETV